MEWPLALLLIFGIFAILMASGLPVAFCFLVANLIGVFLFLGGEAGLVQLTLSMYDSVATFILLPLPLFILMGEVIFHSGVGPLMLDTMDGWLGRLPGRLSLLAVGAGTLFATLTGASFGSVAMLGTVLVPEMEKRGYKKSMTLGPILGSGTLAAMIPPSGLGILLAVIAIISIGKFLIAIIVPGLLLAILFAAYIIVRCSLQPSIAPSYHVLHKPLSEKLVATVRYITPVGIIVFMVVGVIIVGIATPTEAAATGALGCYFVAAISGKLNWQVVKKSMASTVRITVMVLMIIAGARAFGQILSFAGVSQGLVDFTVGLPLPPILIVIAMQVLVLIMGMFMDPGAILMVTLPLFMPIVYALGFNDIWFGVIILMNIEVAGISPPFGLSLFVMKGVAPPDTTMADVYQASYPFVAIIVVAMALVVAFPMLALWLPSVMR